MWLPSIMTYAKEQFSVKLITLPPFIGSTKAVLLLSSLRHISFVYLEFISASTAMFRVMITYPASATRWQMTPLAYFISLTHNFFIILSLNFLSTPPFGLSRYRPQYFHAWPLPCAKRCVHWSLYWSSRQHLHPLATMVLFHNWIGPLSPSQSLHGQSKNPTRHQDMLQSSLKRLKITYSQLGRRSLQWVK